MKLRATWLICLFATTPIFACARCSDPSLTATVPAFRASQKSRLDALLHFGEIHNVCFGIEYVDARLLTEPVQIRVPSGNIEQTIRAILGNDPRYSLEIHEKVIQIGRIVSEPHAASIFDYVLPAFESRRGSLQAISNLLNMQLVSDLKAPEVIGFAGDYSPGDLHDEIGPFTERNRTLRFLLGVILSETKGGAWISGIDWKLRGDFALPEKRRVWTFVEYGVPSTGYDRILGSIAAGLEAGKTSPIP